MKRQEGYEVEYASRIEAIRQSMFKKGIELAFIVQNVDRFYFTGTIQDGVLLLPCGNKPVLFIRRSYERAKDESYVKDIVKIKGLRDIREYIFDVGFKCRTIGIEMDTVPVLIFNRLRELFPESSFADISEDIMDLRAVKSEFEQLFLFEAGTRIGTILHELSFLIKEGITEYEIHRCLTETLVRSGSLQYGRVRAFNMEVISNYIMCGSNARMFSFLNSATAGGKGISPAFPAGSSFDSVNKGTPLVVDMLFNFNGYYCDCTRIFSVGKPERKFIKAYDISIKIHEIFKECVERGISVDKMWDMVEAIVNRENFEKNFMPELGFFGHGIGLELDEKPFIYPGNREAISEGSVVAIEPKFVFDDGVVGVENTYVIKKGRAISVIPLDERMWIL